MKRPSFIKTAALSLAAISTLAAAPAFAQGGPDPEDRKILKSFNQGSKNTVTKARTSSVQSTTTQEERIARSQKARRGR